MKYGKGKNESVIEKITFKSTFTYFIKDDDLKKKYQGNGFTPSIEKGRLYGNIRF